MSAFAVHAPSDRTPRTSRLSALAAGLGLLAALAIMPVRPAAAADSPIVTSFSGFMTVGAGKVLSGTQDQAVNQGYNCPCYVSDFAQGGVYESGGVRLGPDSRIGLQMRIATQDDRFGLVGQGVQHLRGHGRGVCPQHVALGLG